MFWPGLLSHIQFLTAQNWMNTFKFQLSMFFLRRFWPSPADVSLSFIEVTSQCGHTWSLFDGSACVPPFLSVSLLPVSVSSRSSLLSSAPRMQSVRQQSSSERTHLQQSRRRRRTQTQTMRFLQKPQRQTFIWQLPPLSLHLSWAAPRCQVVSAWIAFHLETVRLAFSSRLMQELKKFMHEWMKNYAFKSYWIRV